MDIKVITTENLLKLWNVIVEKKEQDNPKYQFYKNELEVRNAL